MNGYRNAQATVLAPTGTIAFMMDCDTTGIEPSIAVVSYKKLAGQSDSTIKMVNHTVALGLDRLGYGDRLTTGIMRKEGPTAFETERDAIMSYIEENDTIEGAPYFKPEHLPVFDCAFKAFKGTRYISHMGHLKMMAACQPFISGAISKTVNLPEDATVEDIFDAYVQGWKLDLKAVAIYRENSKRSQPLNVKSDDLKEEAEETPVFFHADISDEDKSILVDMLRQHQSGEQMLIGNFPLGPVRRRLPDQRPSITHKFTIAGQEGYITVGLYPESRDPGEIFITMAKQGSTLSGLMDAFATSISLNLQYGVPLEDLVRKFRGSQFEPAGFTRNEKVRSCTSIVDYIFKWLEVEFLTNKAQDDGNSSEEDEPFSVGKSFEVDKQGNANIDGWVMPAEQKEVESGPPCSNCSNLTVRQGSCYLCTNCGTTTGCG